MAAKAPENIEHGGYDYEFVGKVPDKYGCQICTKVYRTPRMTDCCGQHYCESCLEHWSKKQHGKKSCPHCREENFNHILNREKQQEIRRLKIHCTHHQEGCQWVGELDSLQTHLNSDSGCGYVKVNCTKNCGQEVKRKDLNNHLTTKCHLRKYKCPYCSHVDTYQAVVSKHYDTCPGYPLPCPNKCGKNGIRRKDMGVHIARCPLEQVSCLNGCGEEMKRKDLQNHLDSCPMRKYKCPYCSHVDTYQTIIGQHHHKCPDYPLPCPNNCGGSAIRRKDMDTHKEICPLQPVSCTNNCGATAIPRKDMNNHRAVCPLEPVECLFKDAGCEAWVARKDTKTHMASNTQQHLVQMMTAFQTQKSEYEKRLATLEESQKQSQIQSQIQFQILQEGISVYTRPLLKTCTEKQKVRMNCIQVLLDNPNQLHLKKKGDFFTIIMTDFSEYKKNQEVWHSPLFYYRAGYKMRLAVYANGTGAGAGTHVSVSLLLLRGEFDDQLTWPMGKEGDGIEITAIQVKQTASKISEAFGTFLLCPKCTSTASLQRVLDDKDSRVLGSNEKFADCNIVQQSMHDSVALGISVSSHKHKP